MGDLSLAELFTILPDAEQTLAPQQPIHPPIKKKFTCFMDLTPEIRLDIYNLLFPPVRSVNLAPQKSRRKGACHCGPKQCIHHPITLFICHESRAETLLHYRAVVRDRVKSGKRVGGDIIYYRPRQDSLHIMWKSVKWLGVHKQRDWVKSFQEHNAPRFLEELGHLEVRNWEWKDQVGASLVEHQIGLLPLVRQLKTLDVVWNSWFLWALEVSEGKEEVARARKDGVQALKDYFEELRMRDDEADGTLRTVPEITLIDESTEERRLGRWR